MITKPTFQIPASSGKLVPLLDETFKIKWLQGHQLSLSLSQFTEPFSFRIHELESRLSKLSQAERAEDAKQKELIHGLKVENVDLNLKIAELEREMVSVLIRLKLQCVGKGTPRKVLTMIVLVRITLLYSKSF